MSMDPGDSAVPEHLRTVIHAMEGIAADMQEVRTSTSVLEDVLETIPFPLIVGDGEHWLAVSRRFCELLGWTREALEAETWENLIHPEDRAETEVAIRYVLDSGLDGVVVNRYRCADGSYRRLRWRWGPPGPNTGHTVAVAEDLGAS